MSKINNPLISIIIPVYNAAHYLDECIASVIRQKYESFELILVDDGSTDGCDVICDNWSRKDNRIRAFHQENQGVSAARNHGIKEAHGEYITFVDSDDTISPSYLLDMMDGVDGYDNIDLVVTGTIQHKDGNIKQPIKANNKDVIQLSADDCDKFIDNIGLFYGPISKLYSAEIIKENKVCFPENYSLGEDLLFNFSYLEYVSHIMLLPVANYHYRILPISNLTLYREDRFDIHYYEWHKQVAFLKKKGMWNEKAHDLFCNKLWAIVYEGVFCINTPTCAYLKHILSIDEIAELEKYKDSFKTKKWIKMLILSRNYSLLYYIRKVTKWIYQK